MFLFFFWIFGYSGSIGATSMEMHVKFLEICYLLKQMSPSAKSPEGVNRAWIRNFRKSLIKIYIISSVSAPLQP